MALAHQLQVGQCPLDGGSLAGSSGAIDCVDTRQTAISMLVSAQLLVQLQRWSAVITSVMLSMHMVQLTLEHDGTSTVPLGSDHSALPLP